MPTTETLEGRDILSVKWMEPLSSDELRGCFANIEEQLDSAEDKLHLLFDVRKAKMIPGQAPFLFMRAKIVSHSQLGRMAVIGTNPIAQILAETVIRMSSIHILFFSTEKDALAYLQNGA